MTECETMLQQYWNYIRYVLSILKGKYTGTYSRKALIGSFRGCLSGYECMMYVMTMTL